MAAKKKTKTPLTDAEAFAYARQFVAYCFSSAEADGYQNAEQEEWTNHEPQWGHNGEGRFTVSIAGRDFTMKLEERTAS